MINQHENHDDLSPVFPYMDHDHVQRVESSNARFYSQMWSKQAGLSTVKKVIQYTGNGLGRQQSIKKTRKQSKNQKHR